MNITPQQAHSTMTQINDFIRGQSDCSQRLPHKANQSKEYDRGYNSEEMFRKSELERKQWASR